MDFFQSWMEICEKRDKITKKMPKSKGFPFSYLNTTFNYAIITMECVSYIFVRKRRYTFVFIYKKKMWEGITHGKHQ